jgi:hypothetical protein
MKSTCKVIMNFVNEERLTSSIGNIAHKCQILCKKLSQTMVSTWSLIAPGNNSSTNTAAKGNMAGTAFVSLRSVETINLSLPNPKTKGLSDLYDT